MCGRQQNRRKTFMGERCAPQLLEAFRGSVIQVPDFFIINSRAYNMHVWRHGYMNTYRSIRTLIRTEAIVRDVVAYTPEDIKKISAVYLFRSFGAT